MADIVLVHGAWQGAWCWDRVVPLLGARHRVLAPTLAGSGDRAGELSPEIGLDSHVADVAATITDRADGAVLLVGHSYAGMVISAVADMLPQRVRGLVYLDAFYPHDGDSAFELMPVPFQQRFREIAAKDGDGWRLPASDALLDVWGLHDIDQRQWVRHQLTDWSLNCFTSPVSLPRGARASLPRTFVSAVAERYPARAAFGALAQRAKEDGCRLVELATGHDVMIEAPDEVAEVLLQATSE